MGVEINLLRKKYDKQLMTFKSKSVGFLMISVRRAVFVTGTSSKATIGFP